MFARVHWQELSLVTYQLLDWEVHPGLGARNQGRVAALSVTDREYRSPASRAGSSSCGLSLPLSPLW